MSSTRCSSAAPLGAEPGLDTAESCWLCDRERGELCHVHDPVERAWGARRREDDEVPMAWAAEGHDGGDLR